MAKENEGLLTWQSSKEIFALAWKHHLLSLAGPLQQWKNSSALPPVILLTGPAGIGKRAVASSLAQWFLCENRSTAPLDQTPCHRCSPCLTAEASQSVNITELRADTDEETDSATGSLKIEQFRKLKEKMGFGTEGPVSKVILIPRADRMTPQASNSVLKLLEEPPRGWVFILTCNDPSLLLPTLVSRCHSLKLKPFPPSTIESLLSLARIAPERAKICAALSQGSMERALLFSKDAVWEQRKTIVQFLSDPGRHLQTLIDWASSDPAHFEVLLDLMEQSAANLVFWSASENSYAWPQEDLKSEFADHAKQVQKKLGGLAQARNFWIERNLHLSEIRLRATVPTNRKLLIQDLLLPWMGV